LSKINSKFIEGLDTVAGDISPASFSISNNQSSPTAVTGLVFSNAVTRAAHIFYSIEIDATTAIYEAGALTVIQRGSNWDIIQGNVVGDDSNIHFNITTSGQVTYTSPNYAGFVSGKIKFRANTTLVG
jgi:hypothetical protein